MFRYIVILFLLLPSSGFANSQRKATKKPKLIETAAGMPAPQKVQTNVVRDCKSIAIGECFKVEGIGRSYMGRFTGLAIEPHGSSEHYSVFEVSVEAVAPRERCDLNMNCVGTFFICPIKGQRVHNRPSVCLQTMSHITHTPTDNGA